MSKILYKKKFVEICYGFVTGEGFRFGPPPPAPTDSWFRSQDIKMKALHSDKTIAFFSIFLFVQYFKHKELGPRLKWAWLNVAVLYGGPSKMAATSMDIILQKNGI